MVLTVADTGPGIDPELLPHVFDRFVKGETSRGSGLGLAIARGLVEAHGGTISVDVAGRWRDDVPGLAASRYGRLIRTSSTAASIVLAVPQVGRLEHDPHLLTGPRRHRDRDRRPRRLVDVRGALLLLDERPCPVLALDVGPEEVALVAFELCAK